MEVVNNPNALRRTACKTIGNRPRSHIGRDIGYATDKKMVKSKIEIARNVRRYTDKTYRRTIAYTPRDKKFPSMNISHHNLHRLVIGLGGRY